MECNALFRLATVESYGHRRLQCKELMFLLMKKLFWRSTKTEKNAAAMLIALFPNSGLLLLPLPLPIPLHYHCHYHYHYHYRTITITIIITIIIIIIITIVTTIIIINLQCSGKNLPDMICG